MGKWINGYGKQAKAVIIRDSYTPFNGKKLR